MWRVARDICALRSINLVIGISNRGIVASAARVVAAIAMDISSGIKPQGIMVQ
jgi:hypothetical protein